MTVSRLIAVIIVTAIAATITKGIGGKLGYLIGVSSLVLVSIWFITKTTPILQYISTLETASGEAIVIITKVIGISYLSEFASSVCRDMGESTIATGAETVGKAEILMLGFPLFKKMIDVCTELIG